MKVYDRGTYKESKNCLNCKLPFTNRKKWKNNFDEIKFCSKKCKLEFKK